MPKKLSAYLCPYLRLLIGKGDALGTDTHFTLGSAAEAGLMISVTADRVIDRLIASTPTKEDELTSDARFKKIFAS